jgi:hypothetical protein
LPGTSLHQRLRPPQAAYAEPAHRALTQTLCLCAQIEQSQGRDTIERLEAYSPNQRPSKRWCSDEFAKRQAMPGSALMPANPAI